MPQLLQPYNPWFIGIEAAVAAAVVGGAVDVAPSMGTAVGIAVVIGAWNYWVQKEYPVPRKLIEKAEVLKYKQELNKDERVNKLLGNPLTQAQLREGAADQTIQWASKSVSSNAALQF